MKPSPFDYVAPTSLAEALDVPLRMLFVPQLSTEQGRIENRTKTGAAA